MTAAGRAVILSLPGCQRSRDIVRATKRMYLAVAVAVAAAAVAVVCFVVAIALSWRSSQPAYGPRTLSRGHRVVRTVYALTRAAR